MTMFRMKPAGIAFAATVLTAIAGLQQAASAANEVEVAISIKNHRFEPAEVKVPADKAIKLTVKNRDSTAEEFESKPLKVEKVIGGNSSAVIRLRAQPKGSYSFFGDYHEKTAQGMLIVE